MNSAIVLAVIAAVLFYRMGDYEARDGRRSNGLLWALLSVAVSWLVLAVLEGGVALEVFGQAALFVGIGIFRAVRDP